MTDEQLASLKVNQARLMEDLHFSCQWGTGEKWGEYVDAPAKRYFESGIDVLTS